MIVPTPVEYSPEDTHLEPTRGSGTVLKIRPTRGWVSLNLPDLWHYRELIYFLTWRDIRVRYKQTVLGAGWAILQPILTMVVFSIFFGKLAKMPSDGIPYPLFSLCAIVPWTFFANGMNQASNSLVGAAHVIKKIYFPRLSLPIATIVACLVDFGISMVVTLVFMATYGVYPSAKMLFLPAYLLLAFAIALGVGLWLSALYVQYRDVRYIVPFLVQFWMYATPIAYPSSLLKGVWRDIYALNPMVTVVEGFRWAMLGATPPNQAMVTLSCAVTLVVLLTGLFFFRRVERTFADIV
jgi:lipopolysaccharide transport system permease protein